MADRRPLGSEHGHGPAVRYAGRGLRALVLAVVAVMLAVPLQAAAAGGSLPRASAALVTPVVTSTDYPESNPADPADPWYDGVGRYGTFTVSAPGASKITWVVDSDPRTSGSAPVTNGVATFELMPIRSGSNFLEVRAIAPDGSSSAPVTYVFRVGAGKPAVAHWKTDETSGSTLADSGDKTGGLATFDARTHGGVTLGAPGILGRAISTDGSTGYAETSGPVVDPAAGYSIAAWVNLRQAGAQQAAVSQNAGAGSSFSLRYSAAENRWSMSAGGAQALSAKAPVLGTWTHLIGEYDVTARVVRLYVNGVLEGTAPLSRSRDGRAGPLVIGRAQAHGHKTDFFRGSVDDVRAYGRIVSVVEMPELTAVPHRVTGRWRLNSADGSPLTSANDVDSGSPMTLAGQSGIDSGNAYVGSGALSLNGTGGQEDYASTQGVDTQGSFTISAWAVAPAEPTRKTTLFSLAGSDGAGLTVRYNPTAALGGGAWEADLVSKDADATAATHHYAHYYGFGQGGGGWDLVTVVYDSVARRLTLYVDGALQDTADPSFHDGVRGFASSGGLQLGRDVVGDAAGAEFWAGNIDDVWLFEGALTLSEIQMLNIGAELEIGAMS
ncbi:LamG-like jellyroll fold domain-containing protein [Actinomadura scrupuli]|uniref:LamG domain-containing protein n=1 Tax=Actinomadura scrupuli TaxID=559629 RepID=UPI003D967639